MNQGVRYILKLVICGSFSVGKTSIRRNYMGTAFIIDHLPTLGADIAVKKLQLEDGSDLELQIWDLAGQPDYELIRQRFCIGASSVFIVFDLTLRESFMEIDNWLEQFWKVHPSKDLPIVILGNKVDLENHVVKDNEVEAYISKLKVDNNMPDTSIKYYKTSAKTGENIDICFRELTRELIEIVNKEK